MEGDWELCKENIKPLKQGRKMSSLQAALNPSKEEIQAQRQAFEASLRTTTGKDLLDVYHRYMSWIEQNFPKGGHEVNYPQVLESCIQAFVHDQEFFNDKRYVDVWLKYASVSSHKEEIFNCMYNKLIGRNIADFYISWSWEYEQAGNFQRASAVLKEGINMKAQPQADLTAAQKQFHMRLGQAMAQQFQEDVADTQFLPAETRTTLGALKPQGKKHQAGIMRVGDAKLDVPGGVKVPTCKPLEPNSGFRVFSDENGGFATSVAASHGTFPSEIQARKENSLAPGVWTKAHVRQKIVHPPRNGFQVHADGDVTEPNFTPCSVPKTSDVLSARKCYKSPPRALFEPPDPTKKPMYDKFKVYGGTEEFQFEEIRAAKIMAKERELREKALEEERQRKQRELEEEVRKHKEARERETQTLQEEIGRLRAEVVFLKKAMLQSSNRQQTETIQLKIKEIQQNITLAETTLFEPQDYHETATPHAISLKESSSNSTGKSKGSNSNTPNTCTQEAFSMVRALWNGTIAHDSSSAPGSSHKDDMSSNASCKSNQKFEVFHESAENERRGFEVFHDPTQNINEQNVPVSIQKKHGLNERQFLKERKEILQPPDSAEKMDVQHDLPVEEMESENDENLPPPGYEQKPHLRSLNGILQASSGIPVAPLEKEDDENEEEDGLQGIRPLSEENATFAPVNVKRTTSTPFPLETTHPDFGSDFTLGGLTVALKNLPPPSADSVEKTRPALQEMRRVQENRLQLTKGDLSVIMECSKEQQSSKSSSSSSSCTSLSSLLVPSQRPTARQSTEVAGPHFVRPLVPLQKVDADEELQISRHEDIDPFDTDFLKSLLEKLEVPVSEREGYYMYKSKLPLMKNQSVVFLKEQEICCTVLKLHAQGSYAKIYLARPDSQDSLNDSEMDHEDLYEFMENQKVVLKVVKPSHEWEFYVCSELYERLGKLNSPDVKQSVMQIKHAGFYQNGCIFLLDFYKYGNLLELGNAFKSNGMTMPEPMVLYFTLEMLIIMSQIHRCKIIHADIKPDNILVSKLPTLEALENIRSATSCLCFTDFGRAIDMQLLPDRTSFKTVVTTKSFKCTEMMEERPWTYQTDWFGILGSIHVLLFGDYMKVTKGSDGLWSITNKFKRYWQTEFWNKLFKTFLNIPSCSEIPDAIPLIFELYEIINTPARRQELIQKSIQAKQLLKE